MCNTTRTRAVALVAVALTLVAACLLLLLGRSRGETLGDRLYRKMLSQSGHDAYVTACALAEVGDPRALPKLKEIMQSDDDTMKALAVEVAAKIHHPDVLGILLAGASREGWDRLRSESLRSLRRTGLVSHPEAVAYLLQRAEGNDDMAVACVDSLAAVRPPVSKHLIGLYDNTAGSGTLLKKQRIIDALGSIGDEAAVGKLKIIAESDDQELAERARRALNPPKEKPVPPGQPPDYWKRMEEMERQTKEDLYGRDKDREVSVMISLVMHYTYDENPGMVEEAKRSLGRTMAAPPKVRDHELGIIKGLLKHKDPKVRAAAAKALEYCKSLQEEKSPGGG